ncbi:MAG: hemolysin family protein [Acidobacteriota bacterium]
MGEAYFGYRLLLLVFIVALNAFFASAEAALIAVRQSRLRELAEQGQLGAQAALSLLAHPERLLSTVQVGVTLASLGAGWAGEDTVYRFLVRFVEPLVQPALVPALHAASFVLAFLILAFAMVVIGEVVPKNLAIEKADRMAVLVAPPLLVIHRTFRPFVYILERSAAGVTRLLGSRGERGGHSVEELKLIASSVRASGQLSRFEEEVVHRGVGMGNIAVREIMVPRNDIVSIPVDASLEQVWRTFRDHQFSRLPVYEEQPEQIVGVLHYKDLLPARAGAPFRLRALLRKPLVVPESKPLDQMIDEFRLSHQHMALVVNEFGTIVGLATLEDVLEQLLGEIEDEHDLKRPRPQMEAPLLELDGGANIRDLETQYGIELPANAGFETLAGFLLFRLGHIPEPGNAVEHEGRRFTILAMDRRRITRVRVERMASD